MKKEWKFEPDPLTRGYIEFLDKSPIEFDKATELMNNKRMNIIDVEVPKPLCCPQCGYDTVMGIEIVTDDGTKKPGYACSMCFTAFYIEDGEVKEWK